MKLPHIFGLLIPIFIESYMIPSTLIGTWKCLDYNNIRFDITDSYEIKGEFGKGIATMGIKDLNVREDLDSIKMNMTLSNLKLLKIPSIYDYSHIMKGIKYINLIKSRGIIVRIELLNADKDKIKVFFEIPDYIVDSFILVSNNNIVSKYSG